MSPTRLAVVLGLLALAAALAPAARRLEGRPDPCILDTLRGASIPCIDEADDKDLQADLDDFWHEAEQLAGKRGALGRPRFCFLPGVIVLADGPSVKRLLGAYNARRNEAIIGLTHKELGEIGPCTIKHEMLHALGKSDAQINALLPEPCPAAETP